MPTRDLGECLGERPGYRSCGRPEAVVVATVMEVLGQDDQSSAARSGLGRESVARSMFASTSPVASSWTRATGNRMAASYAVGAQGRADRAGPGLGARKSVSS